jgi:hypothetical protein
VTDNDVVGALYPGREKLPHLQSQKLQHLLRCFNNKEDGKYRALAGSQATGHGYIRCLRTRI